MKHYFAWAFALCFLACNRGEIITAQGSSAEVQPGHLHLTPLASAKMASAKKATLGISVQDTTSSANEFNLGTAKSSIQRFFMLKNTGDRDVQDIVLATDNPHFYFSPSRIKVLRPSKDVSVIQVITLNVIHGNRLDGLGYDSLLEMGDNFARAVISGSTTDEAGDTLATGEKVDFQVSAKVLDFKIYKPDGTEPDLSKYGLDSAMRAFTTDPVRNYRGMQGETVNVVNTGNSPFTVRIWHLDPNDLPVLFETLEVSVGGGFPLAPAYIEIDGHGVITNPSKLYLQPASNGRIYLAF